MSTFQGESEANLDGILGDAKALPEHTGPGGRSGSLAKLSISPEALRALPADFVKRHRVLPLKIHDSTIHIATSEPGNQRVIDDIRLLSGLEVLESHVPSAEVLEKIAECYQVTVEQMIENLNPDHGSTLE
ncbi:MAG TPA: hypothetical protein VFC07_07750, partial [Verrucomicrobiae bacterium]|nr:hypothetical protein [Verrucomicrobiae bacterium]